MNRFFYKKFRFYGKFRVRLPENKMFYMFHYGGYLENEVFWKGLFVTWEQDIGWIWQDLCKCSDVVFDIGANTGVYSLVTKCLNPNARVYAFEPSKNTFLSLKKNNDLNNFNINCEKIALSNMNGEQTFYDTPGSNQTSASLSPDILKNFEGFTGEIIEYKVPSMTLSSYIETNLIEKIDLMKIDIELHEPEAIEGLGDYLLTFKPIIIIEVLRAEVANQLNQLINFNDFRLFHLQKDGEAKRLTNFEVFPGENNYLLFHNDLNEKIKQYTSLYENI